MAMFVLVHGAWAGGWAWTRVADLLVARGHRVHAPTLSGLGERSHLADRDIDLTTTPHPTASFKEKLLVEVASGHDIPIERPQELADILEASA